MTQRFNKMQFEAPCCPPQGYTFFYSNGKRIKVMKKPKPSPFFSKGLSDDQMRLRTMFGPSWWTNR